MTNPKLQIPNPNARPTSNAPGGDKANPVTIDGRLGIGYWECVGMWDLELGI